METIVEWIDNKSPPWAAYCAFISVHLIALDKQPSVRPVRVREIWRRLFLKITGPEATMACKDGQLCSRLKVVIDSSVHGD